MDGSSKVGMRVEEEPKIVAEFFRNNPEVVRYLFCVIRLQRATGRPVEWHRVRDGMIPFAVAPNHLERLVRAGVLQRDPSGRYWVDFEDSALLHGLNPAAVALARRIALESSRRVAAAAARRKKEAEHRAKWAIQQEGLRREEAARNADERRMRELAERQQEEARKAEVTRARIAAEEERERARKRAVWEQGDVRDVAAVFGTGDSVIVQLIRRGIPRREIVRNLHAGEHRIARIRKQLKES